MKSDKQNEASVRRESQASPSQPVGKAATLFGPRTKLAFAFILVAGAMVYFAIIAFQAARVDYKSVGDVASAGPTEGKRLEGVKGKLVPESYVRSADGITANFSLMDDGGVATLPVTYSGAIGQVFFNEHSEIIVEGQVEPSGTFRADTLTVKCPSKYLTEQERAELAERDGQQPLAPPYQPDYFSNPSS